MVRSYVLTEVTLPTKLGGALRLTSTVGVGTTAELWLPVAVGVTVAQPVKATVETAPSGRARILLVDDDALIAMSAVDMLEDLGHEVVEANSGAAALTVLESGRPFDLMITDFSMPRMNGGQLALAVRELRPGMPILLATGYAELPAAYELDLPRLGKPYTQGQLAAEIGRLVR